MTILSAGKINRRKIFSWKPPSFVLSTSCHEERKKKHGHHFSFFPTAANFFRFYLQRQNTMDAHKKYLPSNQFCYIQRERKIPSGSKSLLTIDWIMRNFGVLFPDYKSLLSSWNGEVLLACPWISSLAKAFVMFLNCPLANDFVTFFCCPLF